MSKRNFDQYSNDQTYHTLKNMLKIENLTVDYQENFNFNFFSWSKNLIKFAQDYSEIEKIILADVVSPPINKQNYSQKKISRFSADIVFCYLKFHNFLLQFDQEISSQYHQKIEEFERVRLLIKASNDYFGVGKNIIENIAKNIPQDDYQYLALLLLTRNNNFNKILDLFPEIDEYCQEITKKLDPKLLNNIDQILLAVNDQKHFYNLVYQLLKSLDNKDDELLKSASSNQQKTDKFEQQNPSANNENVEQQTTQISEEQELKQEIVDNQMDYEKFKIISQQDDKSSYALVEQEQIDPNKIAYKNPYKIFTTKYDEIIFPTKLVNKNELKNLRNQLDLKITKLSGISRKMRLKLKRKLLSKRNTFLEYDSSRGVLDRKKLSSLILNPNLEEIWLNNKNHEYQDTVLTILLDNSGSMRGNPIVISAMACEIIADILQNFAIKTEIIGFTTADWKGGRVRKLWEISNRPTNPGRLNELRHIVYKHFNQSFKKSKINLGLMLKEGILKENIDGEAILFARSRLMQQSEKRKILLVISDGTPVDDSTSSCNSEDILTLHLKEVINKIEKHGKIEMVGIGIGHSTADFYRNSITIKNIEELGDVMIDKIADML